MRDHINSAIELIKNQDIDGCLTGSCLLDFFEGQDIDVFCYSEAAFTKLLYTLYFNKMFIIEDPLEQWKFDDWTTNANRSSLKKLGLITIKFKYNLLVDVNVIYKEKMNSIFNVLSTFDMDIICKGFDLKTKMYLDLFPHTEKIATWNKWNPAFYDFNIWHLSRILRQFERVIKYQKRGYDTDEVTLKYIDILKQGISYRNIFNSIKVDEKVELIKTNGTILIQILEQWLKTHTISDEELELLRTTVKEI